MTPIEKNIIVIDEQGNKLEATYPKRAKGLVNNGRARFVNENTICLACPPNILEDRFMTDTTVQEKTAKVNAPEATLSAAAEKLTINYVLEQLEKIVFQSDYILGIINELRQMETGAAGDIAGAQKAESLSDVVKCRETTNQQLIRLYEKMYDDLKPQKISIKEKTLDVIERTLNNPTCSDTEKELLTDALDTIRHIND